MDEVTAKKMLLGITPSQRKCLAKVDDRGLIAFTNRTDSFGKSNFRRVMQRLEKAGYVVPYRHGGWEITPAGKEILAKKDPRDA